MPDIKSTSKTSTKSPVNPSINEEKDSLTAKDIASSNENKEDKSADKNKVKEELPEPTIDEDYATLKDMNLLRDVMIRLQYGKHPDKKIDGVLRRRMDLDETKFQGPRVVRAIISILALFFFCVLLFVVIWLCAKSLGLNGIIETSSLVISLFFFSGIGFVIFNNLSVPDEKKLKEAIAEKMKNLEKEVSDLKVKN